MSPRPSALPLEAPVESIGHLALALGGMESSFTGQLLHLIPKGDPVNRARLALAFPREVAAYETWMGFPTWRGSEKRPPTVGELLTVVDKNGWAWG